MSSSANAIAQYSPSARIPQLRPTPLTNVPPPPPPPPRHTTLFMSTLPLDTTARVWDCYLRDGEPLLWRVTLTLLRLLQPKLLTLSRAPALALLRHARSSDAATEKSLFQSLTAESADGGDGGLGDVFTDLQQRLPVPSAEEGGNVCYDLWRNSALFVADVEDMGGGREGPGSARGRHRCVCVCVCASLLYPSCVPPSASLRVTSPHSSIPLPSLSYPATNLHSTPPSSPLPTHVLPIRIHPSGAGALGAVGTVVDRMTCARLVATEQQVATQVARY